MSHELIYSKFKERELSEFTGQELLYDYLTEDLDSDRKLAIEKILRENKKVQKTLEQMKRGMAAAKSLGQMEVAPELLGQFKDLKSPLDQFLEEIKFRNWPFGLRWGSEVIVVLGFVSFCLYAVPWAKLMKFETLGTGTTATLAKVEKTEKQDKSPSLTQANLTPDPATVFKDESVSPSTTSVSPAKNSAISSGAEAANGAHAEVAADVSIDREAAQSLATKRVALQDSFEKLTGALAANIFETSPFNDIERVRNGKVQFNGGSFLARPTTNLATLSTAKAKDLALIAMGPSQGTEGHLAAAKNSVSATTSGASVTTGSATATSATNSPTASTAVVPTTPLSAPTPAAMAGAGANTAVNAGSSSPVNSGGSATSSTTVSGSGAPASSAAGAANATAQTGFLFRGSIRITGIEMNGPKLTEKILQLGGRKAGEVDLGWNKTPKILYYHFTIPESKYDELIAIFNEYGQLKVSKEKHPRVMPEGISRFIVEAEEGP